jgi:hypothetical protein
MWFASGKKVWGEEIIFISSAVFIDYPRRPSMVFIVLINLGSHKIHEDAIENTINLTFANE